MGQKITRALISVSDKTGIEELARFLQKNNVEILSTGGTAKLLKEKDIGVVDVSDYTGFPEIMDGRVKTLHPKVHGGLLAVRDNKEHQEAMEKHAIGPIDLVVVNLYPFEETVAKGASPEETIENIDIGGPSMIRSAAKNHRHVTVVVNPEDYELLMEQIKAQDGETSLEFRKDMASKAFARTASYDAAISKWFAEDRNDPFPETLVCSAKRQQLLRYGENPHQEAALYRIEGSRIGLVDAEQIQGKELSYNNINDTDAALELVAEFQEPACAIIKHANPCGVAIGETLVEAYQKALDCDPTSAFGGIIALNRPLNEDTAEQISKIFVEVIIAPGANDEARAIIARKKNLRLLLLNEMPDNGLADLQVKTIAGGLLFQQRDNLRITEDDLTVVTKRAPTKEELESLLFAFTVCKHVKSNAIVYAKDGATVGIGAGQMSRVDSAKIANRKAAECEQNTHRAKGCVVASDAFFPFSDGLLIAKEAGATAVIQPGGSVRDEEVITAANSHDMAMVLTGKRHFKH